jgi:hypothetical protein
VRIGEDRPAPTESAESEPVTQSLAGSGCSKCSKAARLAAVAANAVRNGDLYRAIEILDELAAAEVVQAGSEPANRRHG